MIFVPQAFHQLELLNGSSPSSWERNIDGIELSLTAAESEPDDKAAGGEEVNAGKTFCQRHGVSEHGEKDGGSELYLLGDRSNRCKQREGLEVLSRQAVVYPERMKPCFLRFSSQPGDELRRDFSG
jgi:hypothetical protein